MAIPALSASDLQHLIASHDAEALARVLRHDQEICSAGGRPSLLAVQLTTVTQELADGIASHLLGDVAIKIPPSILRLQYQEVVGGIKAHAQRIHQSKAATDAEFQTEPALTLSELQTALRVLQFLVNVKSMSPHREVGHAITDIESRITTLESRLRETGEVPVDDAQRGVHSRSSYYQTCYICHSQLSGTSSYPGHPSLCFSCGSFNLSSSELSLPGNLSLDNRSALVTGGRLNLGYHTALRLLRCGARVIVTSRYPRDAETRYREQADFSDWQERLRIVGADFRTSRDVFRLATVVRRTLAEWDPDGVPRLDILINNAAQTLTDSVEVESKAIAQETELRDLNAPSSLLVENDTGYTPRVRGGLGSLALEMSSQGNEVSLMSNGDQSHDGELLLSPNTDASQTATPACGVLSRYSTRPQSSWTQTLPDIPYEDVVSAHSVNTFVPLILIRELLPLMGTTTSTAAPPADPATDTPISKPLHPAGYIINISSREGIFDSSLFPAPSSSGPRLRKSPHHVHNNMSKAALNMITETEAAACWHDRRVCMNSVDPGYMSAAPGFGKNGALPLGWEDGAGRVLWPVAVGWGERVWGLRSVWGRFLKHYRPSRWGGEEF